MTDRNRSVYLITPFTPEADVVLQAVEEAAHALERPVEVVRADLVMQHGLLEERLQELIRGSDAIVADISDATPNVFLELGLGLAFEKPSILLTRRPETVPSNLQGYLYITYDQSANGLTRLTAALRRSLHHVLGMLDEREMAIATSREFPLLGFADFPFERVAQAIESARKEVSMVLGSSARSIADLKQQLWSASARKGVRLRILCLDPESESVSRRSQQFQSELRRSIFSLLDIVSESGAQGQLRLVSEVPTQQFIRVDDDWFLQIPSLYPSSRRSLTILLSSHHGVVRDLLVESFERVWLQASQVTT